MTDPQEPRVGRWCLSLLAGMALIGASHVEARETDDHPPTAAHWAAPTPLVPFLDGYGARVGQDTPTHIGEPGTGVDAPRIRIAQFGAAREERVGVTATDAEDVVETAFLLPDLLVRPLAQDEIELPRPLSSADATRYRRALEAADRGRGPEVEKHLSQVNDTLLVGVVRGQLLLSSGYRAGYDEMARWLERHGDHADALAIHSLALKRKPNKAKAPTRPAPGFLTGQGDTETAIPWDAPYVPSRRTAAGERLTSAVKSALRRGDPAAAASLVDPRDLKGALDPVGLADLQGQIAWAFFTKGEDEKALGLAGPAARIGGRHVPLLHWTAGLSAWRLGRLDMAARHFEALATAEKTSPWNASAGAYWASRTHLRQGRPAESTRWMTRAATFPATFYGILARRALGIELPIHWRNPPLTKLDLEALMTHGGARRALALVQIGETELAERELRRLHPFLDASLTAPLASIAARAGLSSLSIRLGARLAMGENGERWYAALYPIPDLTPRDGWNVDRALILALVRHESGFNPRAVSPAGARGLMQLMPATARAMARKGEPTDLGALLNPTHNLALGQRYVDHLLRHDKIQGNLFHLVAAYNSGPGNLFRWQQAVDHRDDPLLFIESIPSRETRQLIERVLASAWIYRMRLGQPIPSLDAVAAGDWPVYVPHDDQPVLQDASAVRR